MAAVVAELRLGETVGLMPRQDWSRLPSVERKEAERRLAAGHETQSDAGQAECLAGQQALWTFIDGAGRHLHSHGAADQHAPADKHSPTHSRAHGHTPGPTATIETISAFATVPAGEAAAVVAVVDGDTIDVT